MEVKAVFSAITCIFIAIVLSQILPFSTLFGFLLIMAIGMIFMGDLIIGIKTNEYKPLYDRTPVGWELMELQLLDGKTVFMNTKKGPHGKRSFRINNEDATVINDGQSGFILSNGNHGFRAHENLDINIDPFRAKALEKMSAENVKEAYYEARQMLDKKGEPEAAFIKMDEEAVV